MLNIDRASKNTRLMSSLTGIQPNEFILLLSVFEKILLESANNKKRQRAAGAGRKGVLKNAKMKLFYSLLYLKVYPTYDVASFIFGVDRSRCCRWTQSLLPILSKALGRELVLPKRQIKSMEEFMRLCPNVKDLFLDGTERPTQRPVKKQSKKYSGKKRCHTRKNSLICNEDRKILFVSPTKSGRLHDFKQIIKTNVLRYLPPKVALWVDKGFVGIDEYLRSDTEIVIPHKKPKCGSLTPEQKQENKIISSIRITVEHAIGGMKRFAATSDIYRNRKGQDNDFSALAAGLWNLHLKIAK